MSRLKHIVILDPISFAGGSKISTNHVLSQLKNKNVRVSILTADPDSWASSQAYVSILHMPCMLETAEHGIRYFVRHVLIALQLIWLRLFAGRMHTALAASGPGVDFALYLVKPILNFSLVQMVHGPVAVSRTIGRCLMAADNVFFLNTSQNSLSSAVGAAGFHTNIAAHHNFQPFCNGLPTQVWPSQCQYDCPVLYWAASLLKWKGLDTLISSLGKISPSKRPETHICYIRPTKNNLPVSKAPHPMSKVFWHNSPDNLDKIRAHGNIFISTSTREPFGLSILEAMAAGMCVIIPADGAFWDKQLIHNINCLKYQPDNVNSLSEAIVHAQHNLMKVKELGITAKVIAQQYRADLCFSTICDHLITTTDASA
ncbi:glycosyltransferase family 4 protein [Candidatus Enterovibrio escicola]|uniref:glycosyltransferase family 4 protein n=1 Tax=Candidatus Enterovibrio escicola TaxID=1927127 RepID=UPI000BE3A76B|nr:glycosyltransferase family 4 protein [Candidatus Enterovibrio escacola]